MGGYHLGSTRRWANVEALSLPPLEGASVTTDGYSKVVELGDRAVARLKLTVGAHSSADTLDVTIQCSRDGVNNWYSVGAFTQTSAAGSESKTFALDRFVRAKYDVTGSSVSIAVTSLEGEAA